MLLRRLFNSGKSIGATAVRIGDVVTFVYHNKPKGHCLKVREVTVEKVSAISFTGYDTSCRGYRTFNHAKCGPVKLW